MRDDPADLRLHPPTPWARAAAHLRHAAARYRLARWAAAIAAGLTAMIAVDRAFDRANEARSQWGSPSAVVVTTRSMEAGTRLGAADLAILSVPAAVVPHHVIHQPPIGQRLTTRVGPGEILVQERVTAETGSAAAVALPEGTRGVRLDPTEAMGEVGDVVGLYELVSGAFLADGAVVHVDEEGATVAVPLDDVSSVIDAISRGGIVSVLVP